MPSSKGRGSGKGSTQKQAVARRVHNTRLSTKSTKQNRIEKEQYDTLASLPSSKPKSNPKKLTLPSKSTTSPKKQVSSEESSTDGNSTGDKNVLMSSLALTD